MIKFGTDGIRGKFGSQLSLDLILKICSAAGYIFQENGIKKVCVGQDTRISSPIINKFVKIGMEVNGIDVIDMGIVPTASISFTIVNDEKIDAGVMISASHNPYYDNGIKFFGIDGKKISHDIEEEIEEVINSQQDLKIDNKKIVSDHINDENLIDKYINFIKEQGTSLSGYKIGLDCAHGASYEIAPKIFENLGAEIKVMGNEPDGININDEVGSTKTEKFQEFVKKEKLNFGFTYDGDADRVLLIDNDGKLLDGDYILYILAKDLKENNKLANNAVVSTVMSNLGYKKAIKNLNINNLETMVGDKYVIREMDRTQTYLGGEQSGHIILSNLISTGDGILTSVVLSKIITQDNFSFPMLYKELEKYPQVLYNLRCKNKEEIMQNKEFNQYIKEENKKLITSGRILIRASGTENLIRIMVETTTEEKCQEIIIKILKKLEKSVRIIKEN